MSRHRLLDFGFGMKLGTISEVEFHIEVTGGEIWEVHSFTISRESLSFSEIFDSAFATPARYVQEMFFRLCLTEEGHLKVAKFVFNPLYETTRIDVLLVLATLRKLGASGGGLAVLTDSKGMPVGYVFPPWLNTDDSHFLTLLSTVDGEIDAELLRRVFFAEVACFTVEHLRLDRAGHNGFWYEENRSVYRWVAEAANAALKQGVAGNEGGEARRRRDAIRFTAFMPYHAGDVLFFAIAFNGVKSHFSRIVVSKAYLDIVTDNAPDLVALASDIPLTHREDFKRGIVIPDHTHFERIVDALPKDSFYCYLRSSRDYNLTEFHLIDHFAFALGGRACARQNLLFNSRPAPELFEPVIPAAPVRVLLHFDGGWPLKIYPREMQERLIDLLSSNSYEITVLAGEPYSHPKCHVTTFKSYTQLTQLIRSHHILVGMDSFPCHYSIHVLGLPTICLYSSTKPANSNARGAVNYLYLESGLGCRPCYAVAQCPVYRKPFCKNFVSPERVFKEITRMLEAGDREQPQKDIASPPLQTGPDECCLPSPRLAGAVRVTRINMNHLKTKAMLAGMLMPYVRYSSRLYREFIGAVEKEGILLAMLRSMRFVYKVLSR